MYYDVCLSTRLKAMQQKEIMKVEIIDWDSAYKNRPYQETSVHPWVESLHAIFQDHDAKYILDLGCGDGRHLVYLSRLGYRVFGLERSFEGVRSSKKWLVKEDSTFDLISADMVHLPYSSLSFDAVIAIQVIHHNMVSGIKNTIDGVYRVLRDNGLFCATVAKFPPPMDWKISYAEVEKNTYIKEEGFEKGLPHHFFKRIELEEILCPFDVQYLEEDATTGKHLLAFAIKKV